MELCDSGTQITTTERFVSFKAIETDSSRYLYRRLSFIRLEQGKFGKHTFLYEESASTNLDKMNYAQLSRAVQP
ncbi:hypothetical protein Y032_0069g297 [Ancylostoma ceylanicum]|uniref:Uncharacterized protein n=1 Tax=Ancylostoma ceylanicum TaxID=53326 RepID=A0A016TX33_9BILA|nr:hypothetical protein Y032_0069g297 [Ancylostoma ceylanicum]